MNDLYVYHGSSQGLICEYITQLSNYDYYKNAFTHDKSNGSNDYNYISNIIFYKMIQFVTYDIQGYGNKTIFGITCDNYNEKTTELYGLI